MGLAVGLAGCASVPDSINPVSWWHDLEGGPIAQNRAPAPGATAPYPNLASVPVMPPLPGPGERDMISAALLADRTNAHQEALLEPVPAPAGAQQQGTAALFPGPAPTSPPPAGAASATLPAAGGATPPPTTARQAEAMAPAAAPGPAASDAASTASGSSGPDTPEALAAAAAAMPAVPMEPPAPPGLAGIAMPGPPPVPFAAARPGGLRLAFGPGSATVSTAERARLGALAARRGKAEVEVIGFGDAATSDLPAQAAALNLGLARASAIAAALGSAGVPADAIRLQAEASGGGAIVRLLK